MIRVVPNLDAKKKKVDYVDLLAHEFVLTDELKEQLKEPIGYLIPNAEITYEEIANFVSTSKIIVTVGDATTENLIRLGFELSVEIVDGKEMRIERALPKSRATTQLSVQNPAGHISRDSLEALKYTVKARKPIRIIVNGEEDLLTLPAILVFPYGTSVIYGQPGKGLVIVKVNSRSRGVAFSFIQRMKVKSVKG